MGRKKESEDKKPRNKRGGNWGLRSNYSGLALPCDAHLAIKPAFLTEAFIAKFSVKDEG